MKESLPIQDKFMLTIKEAAQYFGIGIKQIRRLAEDNLDSFAIVIGNRYMIVRPKFEEYIIDILETAKHFSFCDKSTLLVCSPFCPIFTYQHTSFIK